MLLPVAFFVLAASLAAPAPVAAQPKSPTPQPTIVAEPWGEFKGFPIVFPPNFDRPRIGQEFPYIPALRTDPTTGLKRWVIPAEVTLADLRYAPFPAYDPATIFKNVPKSPVDGRILGGPVPVVNYIPNLIANDTCDIREDLSGVENSLGGYGVGDLFNILWIYRYNVRLLRSFLPMFRTNDEALYGVEDTHVRRACAVRRDLNAAIFYFQNLPIFYPPKRYRTEVFNRLPAQVRTQFNNILFKTPDEFPQVFFFSKDPNDPLFAVLNYEPIVPDTSFASLGVRMFYVGNRTSLGIVSGGTGYHADFYLLTVNPENLCYIVNYNNRGAPFAFCGFDVHNPPMVSLYFFVSSEHWKWNLNVLSDFYGYAVHNIPMIRVPQASKFLPYQEHRARETLFADTALRTLAWVYPPYLLALAEKDAQAGAQLVRKYSGKPFIDAYILLRNEVERRLMRKELPFVNVQAPSPAVSARLPITTLTRLADERGHAAHLPVRPNTVVVYTYESYIGDHPTAVDAHANYTQTVGFFFGEDYVALRQASVFTIDQARINAYNPDMRLKALPGESVIDPDFYRSVFREMAFDVTFFYDYRNGVIGWISCRPLLAFSKLGPPSSMINLAPLLQFAQAGTGNAQFETPALRYAFTETVSTQGNAIGAVWTRDVKKLTFPWPYAETYPESDTWINEREGLRVRATMWITYAQGAPQAMSITKIGRRDERLTVRETLTIAQNITAASPLLNQLFGGIQFRNGVFGANQNWPREAQQCRAEYEPFLRDFNRALDTWFPGKEREYFIAWQHKRVHDTVEYPSRIYVAVYVRADRNAVNEALRAKPELEINGREFKLLPSVYIDKKTGKPELSYVVKEVEGWSLFEIVQQDEAYFPYFSKKP